MCVKFSNKFSKTMTNRPYTISVGVIFFLGNIYYTDSIVGGFIGVV